MHHHVFRKAIAPFVVLVSMAVGPVAFAQTTNIPAEFKSGTKEVLLPRNIGRVPAGNDFNDPEAEFSFKRAKATDHFVLFWSKEYGDDPMTNAAVNRRFDVDAILKESDRYYDYYVNTLKWVNKETSLATKYKMLFFVIGGTGGTAFGGSIENKIGAFWSPASRINRGPYGVVAHELGHSFQALTRADGSRASLGGFGEMTSQYMLWQVLPEWQTFENSHLNDFMRRTHLAFLHSDNQYHSAYPLEYWSEKQGVEFIGKMWREGQPGEDPVMAYKRLTGITQTQFNDEMFDACRRFVTWDMPRIEKVAARYANQHFTSITKAPDAGWYRISPTNTPQNYGYNAIKLQVPSAGTKVSLDFKGIVDTLGTNSVRATNAGWRYGFLASKEDNSRVYSDTFSKTSGTSDFTVPANTKFLWLVVMGAPTEHWTHSGGRGGGGGGARRGNRGGGTNAVTSTNLTVTNAVATATSNLTVISEPTRRGEAAATTNAGRGNVVTATPPVNTIAQWPYAFKLTGTAPDESIVR